MCALVVFSGCFGWMGHLLHLGFCHYMLYSTPCPVVRIARLGFRSGFVKEVAGYGMATEGCPISKEENLRHSVTNMYCRTFRR
jgi:hypothetical protein